MNIQTQASCSSQEITFTNHPETLQNDNFYSMNYEKGSYVDEISTKSNDSVKSINKAPCQRMSSIDSKQNYFCKGVKASGEDHSRKVSLEDHPKKNQCTNKSKRLGKFTT